MTRYLVKRLGLSLITLLGIAMLVFLVARVLPGDAAALRAGPYATEERLDQVREQYGLNDPLPEQFASYMGNLVQGDLGTSTRTSRPVTIELLERLPASLELGFYAVAFAAVIGIPLGVIAAARRDSWVDASLRSLAVFGSSMALFWLGLLLIYFGFFRFGWFPGPVDRLPIGVAPPPYRTGFYTFDAVLAGDLHLAWTALHHLMLPVLTLGLVLAAPVLKMVRAAMRDSIDSDYVRTARSIGVPRRRWLLVDAFRNALIPVVTTLGIVFGYMLGGNIIVEFLFSWPGVGRYAYQAIQTNDLEALQGFVILVGVLYVALNLAIDLLYARIDPRIRLGGKVGA